jgi:histidine triad (HIT) family protein
VQKIARAQQKAFNESVNSKIVGEEVPHAHVWLFPNPRATKGDPKDFVGNAEKILAAL